METPRSCTRPAGGTGELGADDFKRAGRKGGRVKRPRRASCASAGPPALPPRCPGTARGLFYHQGIRAPAEPAAHRHGQGHADARQRYERPRRAEPCPSRRLSHGTSLPGLSARLLPRDPEARSSFVRLAIVHPPPAPASRTHIPKAQATSARGSGGDVGADSLHAADDGLIHQGPLASCFCVIPCCGASATAHLMDWRNWRRSPSIRHRHRRKRPAQHEYLCEQAPSQ